MPTKQTKKAVTKRDVVEVLAWLKDHATPQYHANLKRLGITAKKAYGVSVKGIQILGTTLGRNRRLAAALWETEWYGARMLGAFIAEPARVAPAQMVRWCRAFDNWGICGSLCFH